METPQRQTDDKNQKAIFHRFTDYGIFPSKRTIKAPKPNGRKDGAIKAPTKLI
jgi:hypothetical protein